MLHFKKLHQSAVLPARAKAGDAGLDLVAVTAKITEDYVEYGTGVAAEIPPGYVGLIFPRSSMSKTSQSFANAVGVIDSGYRGEIKFRMRNVAGYEHLTEYTVGDRVGQLVVVPYLTADGIFVEELSGTERGDGGFGSSGK